MVALIWWAIAWFANRGIIDAITGAQPVDRMSEPRLWNLLENLCISRGITMPTLRIIETPQRNAFASGIREKQYAITVTRGLMDALDDAELEAVLAHELTHIRNRDVQLLVICAVFVGIITLVGELVVRSPRALLSVASRGSSRSSGKGKGGGAVLILILVAIGIFLLARFLGIALRFALSRKREYLADAGSVELTRNPDAMIGALRKIAGHSRDRRPRPGAGDVHRLPGGRRPRRRGSPPTRRSSRASRRSSAMPAASIFPSTPSFPGPAAAPDRRRSGVVGRAATRAVGMTGDGAPILAYRSAGRPDRRRQGGGA